MKTDYACVNQNLRLNKNPNFTIRHGSPLFRHYTKTVDYSVINSRSSCFTARLVIFESRNQRKFLITVAKKGLVAKKVTVLIT